MSEQKPEITHVQALRFAQSQAVTERARGRSDEERAWLDMCALLERVGVPDVSTRRTDWGVRDDATGHVGTVLAYSRAATEKWLAELAEPSTLMCRERTTYRDDLTEWEEVDD